jgi:hypothetical protein
LLSLAGANLSAVIIQVLNGTGKLRFLRPKAPVQMATPMPTPAAPDQPRAGYFSGSARLSIRCRSPNRLAREVSTEAPKNRPAPEQGARKVAETIRQTRFRPLKP